MTRILVFMLNFCHFVLSEAERISNGLRLADNEQILFYTHLIAYFFYEQRKNVCFAQQVVSNLINSICL